MRVPIALSALALSLSLAPACAAEQVPAPQAEVGKPAPAFVLKDTAGVERSLAEFKDKWVVLEWVNFGCPFVKKHYGAGNMQGLQAEYTAKGVVWLSICSSAPGKQGYYEGEELRKEIAERKVAATHYLLDPQGGAGKAYGAKTTPHMYVIDPAGSLVYVGGIDDIPSADPDDLPKAKNWVRLALDAALAGKPVETSTTPPYGCSVKYAEN
ncbi:MAG: thioredoxin family protein [Candidatus Handelsmanbacteria bacterium]|nr:thioredoxin family protein [Candidatus Handelsmanbacteria bacterium]